MDQQRDLCTTMCGKIVRIEVRHEAVSARRIAVCSKHGAGADAGLRLEDKDNSVDGRFDNTWFVLAN